MGPPWLFWRKTEERDIAACMELLPAKNGSDIVGPAATTNAYREMLRSTPFAAKSAVVVLRENEVERIVGFGIGVFVRKDFVESELAHPQPGLNARIVASVAQKRSVLLTYEEIRSANTAADLQQVILHATWDRKSLTPQQVDEVRIVIGQAYQEIFDGYRIARVFTETVDELDAWHAHAHRSFQVKSRFEDWQRAHPETPWNPGRTLTVATAESIREDIGSIAAGLFQGSYQPQFHFTRGEQELLEAALDGKDDTAAAESLYVTVAAIRNRWASIFTRVATVMPALCPLDSEGRRGSEKRSRIIEYVRRHRAEIRPHENMPQP
jgi:hypothetical protein